MAAPNNLCDGVYTAEQTFDGMTVRGVVVCGADRALIFDTLVFPEETKELLRPCGDRELIVVYSHADWDHVWATCGLAPAEIVAHEECAERFADVDDVEKTLNESRSKWESELAAIRLMPPTRTFRSGMTLHLGGISVELRHCPGHTRDSIVAIVPERNLLLGGDCIEEPLPLLNEDAGNLSRWISVLCELEQDARITTCVPSHGEIGGKEPLRNTIAYLQSLFLNDVSAPANLDSFYESGHRENRSKTAAFRRD